MIQSPAKILFMGRVIFLIAVILSLPAMAQPDRFTVYVNDIPHTESQNISPCFPLKVSFFHPNEDVRQVRLEYPIAPRKFFIHPIDSQPDMTFFEDMMHVGDHPYIDFVAEDAGSQEYDRIRMMFYAPKDPDDNECEGRNIS